MYRVAHRTRYYKGMGFERDLQELERSIEKLNREYSAFLYGAVPTAPVETRRQVEALLRRLGAVDMEVAAERYRLSTLQGHYNVLAEKWERQQGEKEGGKRPGFYSAFSGTAARPTGTGARPSQAGHPPGPNAAGAASVHRAGDPAAQGRQLYDRYVRAKAALGEDVTGYDFGQFSESLERERQKIREKTGTDDFEFDVKEADGRVRLVARRKRTEER